MHELPEFPAPIRYRKSVLSDLRGLGVVPRTDSQPRMIYSFLRALMTFEIRERKLKRRELEQMFGPQPLEDYAAEIETLRAKYHLLRRLPQHWID